MGEKKKKNYETFCNFIKLLIFYSTYNSLCETIFEKYNIMILLDLSDFLSKSGFLVNLYSLSRYKTSKLLIITINI